MVEGARVPQLILGQHFKDHWMSFLDNGLGLPADSCVINPVGRFGSNGQLQIRQLWKSVGKKRVDPTGAKKGESLTAVVHTVFLNLSFFFHRRSDHATKIIYQACSSSLGLMQRKFRVDKSNCPWFTTDYKDLLRQREGTCQSNRVVLTYVSKVLHKWWEYSHNYH